MNIIKNNIEHQIKKQIGEREINPSRDLWSEIESQSAMKASKPAFSWSLVAACLILTFGLGVIVFFNHENKQVEKSRPIAEAEKSAVQNRIENPALQAAEQISKNQRQKIAAEDIPADKTSKIQKSQDVAQPEEMPSYKENPAQIISEISPVQQEKAIAKADSVKIKVKKRYVDPSTLLFSVEHKDVIEKTKGGSNVATIDLNTQ